MHYICEGKFFKFFLVIQRGRSKPYCLIVSNKESNYKQLQKSPLRQQTRADQFHLFSLLKSDLERAGANPIEGI